MQSRQQVRAENAYAFICANRGRNNLGGITKKLPMLFQTNGLLAGMAYLIAHVKNEHNSDEYHLLLRDLLKHLQSKTFSFKLEGNDLREIFEKQWIGKNYSACRLRRIADEIIAYSGWLKRAAETYFKE